MAKGITFFSKLSSLIANSTFFIKNADFDEIESRVVLKNTAEPVSGAQIDNVQRYINEAGDTLGITEGDANRKVYATNNIITDGENRKECVEAFDIAVQANIDAISVNTKQINNAAVIANGGQITLDPIAMHQIFRLSGDGGPVTLNALVFSNQPADGARIEIIGQHDVNLITINGNDTQYGQKQNGKMVLGVSARLVYEYDSGLERFQEVSRVRYL